MEKRTKEVKVTFFITGQDDKSKPINTPALFERVWKSHFSDITKSEAITESRVIGETANKELVLKLEEYDADANLYFGHVGVFRDSLLPALFNKESQSDSNIPLGKNDEILEKSYFIYYPSTDLLVFHQNHLGPKADDLAYLLFKATGMSRIVFEPIWKNNDIKSLLETGSTLKNGTLTLALPRNFSEADLDLSNNWSSEVVGMMARTGMSRMTINFWGRASTKKSVVGYIKDDVKEGLRELLTKFDMGSQRKNALQIKKAEAQMTNGGKESLISQELNTRVKVDVIDGYPVKSDIRQALINAKLKCSDSLKPYILKGKDTA